MESSKWLTSVCRQEQFIVFFLKKIIQTASESRLKKLEFSLPHPVKRFQTLR